MTTERETLNANDRFEMLAAAFYEATGMLAPGKDDPLADDSQRVTRTTRFHAFAQGYAAAEFRATPPAAGPVLWIARSKDGRYWMYDREPRYYADIGHWAAHARSGGGEYGLPDCFALLGLQPGECRRVRLSVMPEGVK